MIRDDQITQGELIELGELILTLPTHQHLSQLCKGIFWKRLGKDVGELYFGINLLDPDSVRLEVLVSFDVGVADGVC